MLHLDLKEANVLINFEKDNQSRPECAKLPISFKLADFGVSRDMSARNTHTQPKELIVYHRGTPRYLAPE